MARDARPQRPILTRRSLSAALIGALLVGAVAAPSAAARVWEPAQVTARVAVNVTIVKHPAALSRVNVGQFTWRRSGPVASTQCKLDTRAFTHCTTGIRYTGLAVGTHTFTVKVTGGGHTVSRVYHWLIDQTLPTAPAVAGGSLSWTHTTVTIGASGSTDTGGAGFRGYQWRKSIDAGVHWTAPKLQASIGITGQGESIVQFRSIDKAGNVSAWVPAVAGASNTARIDHGIPTTPTVTGGSSTWQNVAQIDLSAAGSTDTGGSSLAGYEYETSTDGGATWSLPVAGNAYSPTAQGETQVRFHALDVAGNASAWVTALARIDRTPPGDPVITGDSAGWSNAATVTVSAASVDGFGHVNHYEFRTRFNGGLWTTAATGQSVQISAEGITDVQFRAFDDVGFNSNWVQASVRLDHTLPSVPVVTGFGLGWQNAANASANASGGTDNGGSTFNHYVVETSTDGAKTWSAPASANHVTLTGEGTTDVRFASVDGAGNQSAWVSGSVQIDRTAPTAPTVGGGSLTWKTNSSVTLTASQSTDNPGSGVDHYISAISTDGGANWVAQPDGASLAVNGEGETLVRFAAVDTSGLASAWTQATVRLDRVNPTAPTVSGGSATWSNAAKLTLTGAGSTDTPGSGVAGYQYRTSDDDGQTWTVAANGATVDVSAEGTTIVQFRATDGAGRHSSWAPVAADDNSTVKLDRIAPTAATASGGSTGWQTGPVLVTGSNASDSESHVASYEVRTSIDGGATWSAAAPGNSVSVSAEGTTLVQFRATDNAGNTSNWFPTNPTSGSTVKIDDAPPTDPVVSGGSLSWSTSSPVAITGLSTDTGSGVASYQWRTSTDGINWSVATAGGTASISAQGTTYVQFRAFDVSGQHSNWAPVASTAGSTVKIDTLPPTAPTVSGGSLSWLSQASTAVTASNSNDAGSGFAHYEYRTSYFGGAWTSPVSGNSVTVSVEGETTVQFRAIDNVGNIGPWTPTSANAGSTVRLDRSNPTAPVVSGGSSAWQSVASVTVNGGGAVDLGGAGIAHYEYQTSPTGSAPWSATTTGNSLTVSSEGQTIVQFRTVDNAGNASAWVSGTIRIDRGPPTAPTVSGGSLSWLAVASTTVMGSNSIDAGAGFANYEYRTSTDGGTTWSGGTSGASVTISAEGQTLVQFRAIDTLGKATAWTPSSPTAGSTVKIDRSTPVAPTVSGGSSSWQTVASVTVSASGGSDPGSGFAGYQYQTQLNGGAWSSSTSGSSVAVSAEGTTIVQFHTMDNAGNSSAWVQATVKLDRSLPSAPTVAGGSLSWQSAATVTVTGSASTDGVGSGVTGYEYHTSFNGGAWGATVSGASVAISAEGTTLVQFRSVDGVGNRSAWTPAAATAGSTVKLDHTLPTAPSVTGGSSSWLTAASTTITPSGSTDAGGSLFNHYEYRTQLNGGSWSAGVTGATAVISTQGTTIVQFRSVDGAGNPSAWTPASSGAANTVKLDRTAPTAPKVSGGSLACKTGVSRTIYASNSSDGSNSSGFNRYEYHVSLNGGAYGATTIGSSVKITTVGTSTVQFRAVDNVGNASAWAPTTNGSSNTACIK